MLCAKPHSYQNASRAKTHQKRRHVKRCTFKTRTSCTMEQAETGRPSAPALRTSASRDARELARYSGLADRQRGQSLHPLDALRHSPAQSLGRSTCDDQRGAERMALMVGSRAVLRKRDCRHDLAHLRIHRLDVAEARRRPRRLLHRRGGV
jgi:hypothetical protein